MAKKEEAANEVVVEESKEYEVGPNGFPVLSDVHFSLFNELQKQRVQVYQEIGFWEEQVRANRNRLYEQLDSLDSKRGKLVDDFVSTYDVDASKQLKVNPQTRELVTVEMPLQ